MGIGNINVARSIGKLLDHGCLVKPLPLVKDGDLLFLVQCMIQAWGQDRVRVTKVEVHATEADLQQGRVRDEDRLGNAEADTAADLSRRHQSEFVMDVRRALLDAHDHWYPIVQQLHRVAVNHVGRSGSALDPLVWDQGGTQKARRLTVRVNVDLASLPGPPGFLSGPWIQVHGDSISGADVADWPYSVGILCRFTSFFGTLHWPTGSGDIGHFGVSFLEFLILFEQWAGHRLLSEKVTWPHVRANRPILIPSVPVSEGIEIRRGFSSSVTWFGSGQVPGRLVGFRHVELAPTCPGYVISGGINALVGSLPGQWTLVTTCASRLYVGFWVVLKGQLRSFLMAHSSSDTVLLSFTMCFLPWS